MKLALIAIALVACSAGDPGPGVDTAKALEHARALVALGPREGESPAAKRAADYVMQQLGPRASRGEVGTVDLPPIVVMGTTFRHGHRTITTDENLLVRFGPVAGKALLVMAHYDSVRGSPGAID